MRSDRYTFSLTPTQTSTEVLAPLLVLSILVCHGVFGIVHQVTLDPASPGTSYVSFLESHLSHESAPAEKGTPDTGSDAFGYATALVSVLAAAVFWRLLRGAAYLETIRLPRPFHGPLPSFDFCPARGPTPPLLQVFRL